MTNPDIDLSDDTSNSEEYLILPHKELIELDSINRPAFLQNERADNQTIFRLTEDDTSWSFIREIVLEKQDVTVGFDKFINWEIIKTAKSRNFYIETDPFKISFNEFLGLSRNEQKEVRKSAYILKRNKLEKEFATRNAKWLLVCKDEVLDFSDSLEKIPSSEILKKIAEKKNCVPYIFVKPTLIEDFSSWSKLENDDYYPTLKISIGSMNHDDRQSLYQITSDFDTGCPFTYLSLDDLIIHNIISEPDLLSKRMTEHLRSPYVYSDEKVKIYLENQNIKVFSVRCVEDWDSTPFKLINPSRQALTGRDLLLRYPLKIELNGENKSTRIIKSGFHLKIINSFKRLLGSIFNK